MRSQNGTGKNRVSVPLPEKTRDRLRVLAALHQQTAAAFASDLLVESINREHSLEFDALLQRVK